MKNQLEIHELICCDCYFDLCFFLLRRKVNFDEMHNRFNNLSNCFYIVAFNNMMVSCYHFLKFELSNTCYDFPKRNCFKTFYENGTMCIQYINDLFFVLLGKMHEFILCRCNE